MANTFNTVKSTGGIVTKIAAKMLADQLQFGKSIARADETDYDGANGYGAGDTIYISKPARFIPQNTFDITSTQQDIVEEKTPLTLDIISTVGVNITSLQFASEIQIKNLVKRVVEPAVSSIAQDVEKQMLVKAKNAVYNTVGTAGSTTYDVDTVLSAKEKMSKYLAPKDSNRFLLLDSTAGRSAVNSRKGLFQSASEIGKQYEEGFVGKADGFSWFENELVPVHTRGTATGAITVTTTVSAEGQSTINLTGTGAQTLVAGDVFTIANVYAVHPITKQQYPFLQQFVVTANNTASGGAYSSVAISPAFYTSASKGLQNISAFPTSTSSVTLVGSASTSYTNTLAFHKNAFRMVSVPLVMPKAVEFAEQSSVDGVTVSIVRAWDNLTRKMVTRMDFLGGLAADRPEWACKIVS